MNKHRKDSQALLEAFNQVQLSEKDHDGDGKEESPKDEYKGSVDKAIKKAKASEDVKEEKASKPDDDPTPYDGHEDQDDDVQEESRAPGMPEEDVFKAVEMAEDGDWQEAIETTMSAIANHMINDIEQSGNGPLDEVETADVWNIKDGIKLAVEDLLDGQNAETYSTLTKNLRQAFHKGSNKSEDLSQFFDGEPPMPEVHRNHEEPNLDPYDYR